MKILNEALYIFKLNLWNPLYILLLQYIAIRMLIYQKYSICMHACTYVFK